MAALEFPPDFNNLTPFSKLLTLLPSNFIEDSPTISLYCQSGFPLRGDRGRTQRLG